MSRGESFFVGFIAGAFLVFILAVLGHSNTKRTTRVPLCAHMLSTATASDSLRYHTEFGCQINAKERP